VNNSEILNLIESRVGEANLSTSNGRDGCRMSMQDVPRPRVLVDADLAFPAHNMNGKKCDFILFLFENAGRFLTVPVELKRGKFSASEASEQLQRGADFVDRVVPKSVNTLCSPVLFRGRKRIHEKQLKVLNRSKVRFRGKQLTIRIARCDQPGNLALALKR